MVTVPCELEENVFPVAGECTRPQPLLDGVINAPAETAAFGVTFWQLDFFPFLLVIVLF